MRQVLLLLGFAASSLSCAQFFQCQSGQCPTGEECVFVSGSSVPKCRATCAIADGGSSTCPGGETCSCAGSCAGCENCIFVCTQ